MPPTDVQFQKMPLYSSGLRQARLRSPVGELGKMLPLEGYRAYARAKWLLAPTGHQIYLRRGWSHSFDLAYHS